MSKCVLPVAIALTVAIASVGAYGQSPASAARVPAPHSHRFALPSAPAAVKHSQKGHRAEVRKGFEAWRVWCKVHQPCLHQYGWVARGNASVRHAKWRLWCLNRSGCAKRYNWLHWRYYLTGPVGGEISRLPEGAYTATFMQAASAYGVSPEIMMGIGIVESGGGVAGTAYEGCMNYATFGSWPGQIDCAAQVLSRVGLAGYNSVNPSYASTVMGQAAGIGIVKR